MLSMTVAPEGIPVLEKVQTLETLEASRPNCPQAQQPYNVVDGICISEKTISTLIKVAKLDHMQFLFMCFLLKSRMKV